MPGASVGAKSISTTRQRIELHGSETWGDEISLAESTTDSPTRVSSEHFSYDLSSCGKARTKAEARTIKANPETLPATSAVLSVRFSTHAGRGGYHTPKTYVDKYSSALHAVSMEEEEIRAQNMQKSINSSPISQRKRSVFRRRKPPPPIFNAKYSLPSPQISLYNLITQITIISKTRPKTLYTPKESRRG